MPSNTKLLFLAGSARADSVNAKLAKLAASIATANGLPATFADLGDYPLPLYDGDLEAKSGVPDNATKLKSLMLIHKGVFIASPEYNASITPLLKNTLDWISRAQSAQDRADGVSPLHVFKSRVFALGAASPGAFGGLRGCLATRQVLELGLGALVLPDQILIPKALAAFDENGHLADKPLNAQLKAVVERLAVAARVLHGA
jgi:chromate reductase, NAD(P)H dehydrogenase (quinone)